MQFCLCVYPVKTGLLIHSRSSLSRFAVILTRLWKHFIHSTNKKEKNKIRLKNPQENSSIVIQIPCTGFKTSVLIWKEGFWSCFSRNSLDYQSCVWIRCNKCHHKSDKTASQGGSIFSLQSFMLGGRSLKQLVSEREECWHSALLLFILSGTTQDHVAHTQGCSSHLSLIQKLPHRCDRRSLFSWWVSVS